MEVLQSKKKLHNFNPEAEKYVSDATRKRRRIYLEDLSEVADFKYDRLASKGIASAESYLEKNPIVKAIRFLSILDAEGIELEFDTPNASAYAFESKYVEQKQALQNKGFYGDLTDKAGKPNKDVITSVSYVYLIQNCIVKVIDNKPVVNSRSGYVHITDRDAVIELMGITALDEKQATKLLNDFASTLIAMLPNGVGERLMSVPKTFDYFHYRFQNGVLDARTGMFFEGDTTSDCMYDCNYKYQCSTEAENIFEQFVSYLAMDADGIIDLEKRRQIIGFMLYPVCYNVADKDISVLFGSGGNGKSALGDLMSFAYGSMGIGKSYLSATKKASGTYMNKEISSAFSKNSAFFDEETFSHVEQAEQMKHFIDQTISYEIRNLGASSIDLAIRGVVMFNSNTTGLIGASRSNTWLTRRFTGIKFEFVFDNNPEAKAWIKKAFHNNNGVYSNFNQADILFWLMKQRKNYSIADLEHPLKNVAEVLSLADDIDEGDIITNIVRRNSVCYAELGAYGKSLPEKNSIFPSVENVRGAWLNKALTREIGLALGEPKMNRDQIKRIVDLETDGLAIYESSRCTYILYEDSSVPTPDPEPTKRDEIIKQVAEEEGMLAEVPNPMSDDQETTSTVTESEISGALAQLEALSAFYEQAEQVVPEEPKTSQEASYEVSVITKQGNVYSTDPTEYVVTDIHDLVFPDNGGKHTMPKLFPDNRETRGDYSKKSGLLFFDFDHIVACNVEEVVAKLETLNIEMYVQESYSSSFGNIGIHVFMPMSKRLGNLEWKQYRNNLSEMIKEKTGLDHDTKHNGFTGILYGTPNPIIDVKGARLNPPIKALQIQLESSRHNEVKEDWTADRMTVSMYLDMNSQPSREFKELIEVGELDAFDGERNDKVFMLAKDLVGMQNRNAFQNGVFDELWETLNNLVSASSDASEYLQRMSSIINDLQL